MEEGFTPTNCTRPEYTDSQEALHIPYHLSRWSQQRSRDRSTFSRGKIAEDDYLFAGLAGVGKLPGEVAIGEIAWDRWTTLKLAVSADRRYKQFSSTDDGTFVLCHRLMGEPSGPRLLCQVTDGVTLSYLDLPTIDFWRCFLRMVDYSRYYSRVSEAGCCMLIWNPHLIMASGILYSD